MKTVPLTHPDHGGVYNAPQSAVPFWTARGWKVQGESTRRQYRTGSSPQLKERETPVIEPAPPAPLTAAAKRTTRKAGEQQ